MPVLSLPHSFTNSFWSTDLRTGFDVLFRKLDHGPLENDQLIAFIRVCFSLPLPPFPHLLSQLRSAAESHLAAALAHQAPIPPSGFGADDGASLLMAFRGLQAESATQAKVHENVANELNTLVISPFSEWAQGYKDRIKHTKSTVLDSWLRNYEQAQADAQKLKQQYLAKTRRADDAEDE